MKCTLLFSIFLVLLTGCGEVTITPDCTLAAYSRSNSGDEIAIGKTTYGGSSTTQAFVPTSSNTAKTVVVSLKKTGSFTVNSETLTARIESNSAGAPSGTVLGTSSTIDPSTITTTSSTVVFSFTTPPSLTEGTQYWLVIKASYSLSNTNYISWFGINGLAYAYTYNGTPLQALYETSSPGVYNSAQIGGNRFLSFKIGC